MEKLEKTYKDIKDLYLGSLKLFSKKPFSWFEEHYSNINMLLKEYFKAAQSIYNSDVDYDTKLIGLLKIKVKMLKEIDFYKNI